MTITTGPLEDHAGRSTTISLQSDAQDCGTAFHAALSHLRTWRKISLETRAF